MTSSSSISVNASIGRWAANRVCMAELKLFEQQQHLITQRFSMLELLGTKWRKSVAKRLKREAVRRGGDGLVPVFGQWRSVLRGRAPSPPLLSRLLERTFLAACSKSLCSPREGTRPTGFPRL